jgi:hypothetical protein
MKGRGTGRGTRCIPPCLREWVYTSVVVVVVVAGGGDVVVEVCGNWTPRKREVGVRVWI